MINKIFESKIITVILIILTLIVLYKTFNISDKSIRNLSDIEFSILVFDNFNDMSHFLRSSYDITTKNDVHIIASSVDNFCQIFLIEDKVVHLHKIMSRCTEI